MICKDYDLDCILTLLYNMYLSWIFEYIWTCLILFEHIMLLALSVWRHGNDRLDFTETSNLISLFGIVQLSWIQSDSWQKGQNVDRCPGPFCQHRKLSWRLASVCFEVGNLQNESCRLNGSVMRFLKHSKTGELTYGVSLSRMISYPLYKRCEVGIQFRFILVSPGAPVLIFAQPICFFFFFFRGLLEEKKDFASATRRHFLPDSCFRLYLSMLYDTIYI